MPRQVRTQIRGWRTRRGRLEATNLALSMLGVSLLSGLIGFAISTGSRHPDSHSASPNHLAAAAGAPHAGKPTPVRTTWPSTLPQLPLPTSVPDGSCGPWSAPDGRSGQSIALEHGALQSCFRVGRIWVVTTQHTSGPADIGTYVCPSGDETCMNGWNEHDLTAFTWHTAPAGQSLRLLSINTPTLEFYDGVGIIKFSLDRKQFES